MKERPDVRLPEMWDDTWNAEPEYHAGLGLDLKLWREMDDELRKLLGPIIIADVAGGRGEFLWWIRTEGETLVEWSTLFDFSSVAIEAARKAGRADEYCLCPAEEIGYEDSAFHVTVAIDLLQVVDDPRVVLAELCRVTAKKDGKVTPASLGRVVFVIAETPHWQQLHRLETAEWYAMAREFGEVEAAISVDDPAGHVLYVIKPRGVAGIV